MVSVMRAAGNGFEGSITGSLTGLSSTLHDVSIMPELTTTMAAINRIIFFFFILYY
jgi:hypothetical protein